MLVLDLQLFFCPAAFSDVLSRTEQADIGAGLVFQEFVAPGNQALFAGTPQHQVFYIGGKVELALHTAQKTGPNVFPDGGG